MSGVKVNKKFIDSMVKATHFSEKEVERLLEMHQGGPKCKEKMDRKLFREFLHSSFDITDDIIMDRIYKFFNTDATDDITQEEWLEGFSVFLKGQIIKKQKMQIWQAILQSRSGTALRSTT